ncbi:hypothetical protein [Aquihabitans sp. McL0605]
MRILRLQMMTIGVLYRCLMALTARGAGEALDGVWEPFMQMDD